MLNAFKIVEIVDGRTRTLFHAGGTGSRYVPMNTWIRAYEGMVMDGSRQEPYRAGHHFFIHYCDAENYLLEAFRERLELLHVVPVQVRVIRRKPNGRNGVMLARWIRYVDFPGH